MTREDLLAFFIPPGEEAVKPSSTFRAFVEVSPPGDGTPARKALLRWLNLEHCGAEMAPAECTEEHKESHWRLAMHTSAILAVRIDKSGAPTPIAMIMGGEEYAITPANRSAE
jgi:hypothetical protein